MADEMDLDDIEPRGTKRKVDDLQKASAEPRRITQLDPDVVNKIAAGEIIVAPVHALKELIENSVDAGSTSLEVMVKDGGLKLLQISDNGHGINRNDLPILCERFTTSKLTAFEDLTSIGTYGFRGEALASISHIAHLTVTTRTADSNCAWRAHYSSGLLAPSKPGQSAEPKPIAGRQGTQITVEDLFYNVPIRRKAFRTASDEYNKILDLVGRYAVHCGGVAFSCKKAGESSTALSIQASASTLDRIRQIHGSGVAGELIEFESSDQGWGFKARGWATNANYHVKRTTLLLFINHRSVESSNIRKAIEHLYSPFLPKGGHPFVYLSLDVEPHRVDVNVHPTKREVNFLNEDDITEKICSDIREKLAHVDTSRKFLTQTLLPGAFGSTATAGPNLSDTQAKTSSSSKPYENNLVRTDAKLRKITSMLPTKNAAAAAATTNSPASNRDSNDARTTLEGIEYTIAATTTSSAHEPRPCLLRTVAELRAAVRDDAHAELTDVVGGHAFVGVVDERRRLAAIQGGVRLFLVDYGAMANAYFYQVGLTDFGNFGAINFEPPLSLDALLRVGAEHERRRMMEEREEEQESKRKKGKAAATSRHGADNGNVEDDDCDGDDDDDLDDDDDDDDDDFDVDEVVALVSAQLVQRRAMLAEYFSLDISEARELRSIPLLLKGYAPSMAKLPRFLLRLGPHVDWMREKECFASFLSELAAFYVPERLPAASVLASAPASTSAGPAAAAAATAGEGEGGGEDGGEGEEGNGEGAEDEEEMERRRAAVRRAVEHVLFPAFAARLVATKELMRAGVLEIANLKGLYRIFERC